MKLIRILSITVILFALTMVSNIDENLKTAYAVDSVLITFPSDGQTVNANTFTITGTAFDNVNGIDNVGISIDGGQGNFKGSFVIDVSDDLKAPFRLTFGPDGNLYVGSADTNEILRYNGTTGAFIDAFVTSGSGGLFSPRELTFGPDGNLYVTSLLTNQVLHYDPFEDAMGTTSWTFPVTDLDDGPHTISSRATDGMGGSATVTISIEVLSNASPTFVLDATDSQGDCATIGTWNQDELECTLTSNVNGRIVIADDNIELVGEDDYNDVIHKVIGDGTGGVGIKIKSGVTGAEIKSIIVTGHNNGIVINGNDNKVKEAIARNNMSNGIVVNGDDNKVEKSKANNNDKNGIVVNGDDNELKENIANRNTDNGIKLNASSSDTELNRNTANGNGEYGINKADAATVGEIEKKNKCRNNSINGSTPRGLC